jgi:hypothetical protein
MLHLVLLGGIAGAIAGLDNGAGELKDVSAEGLSYCMLIS